MLSEQAVSEIGIILLSALIASKPLMSPRGAEVFGVRNNNIIVDTNYYDEIKFNWDCGTNNFDSFKLYYGGSPGVYTNVISNIASTNYTFRKTNWNEYDRRHYFAVSTISYGMESDNSYEVWWPPLDNSHLRLTWPNIKTNTTILTFNSLDNPVYKTLAIVSNTNTFTTNLNKSPGAHMFKLFNNSGPLTFTAFNPTNDIIYGTTNWIR